MPAHTKPPVVSVIMANYNGAAHIDAALKSVLAQTVRNIEVLVSDDASTDQSVAVVQSIAAIDPRVKLINSTINRGPGAARNRALDAAIGDWIAIVDADDLIHPRRFERMIEFAERFKTDAIADDMLSFSDERINESKALFIQLGEKRPLNITIQRLISSDIQPARQVPFGYLKPMFRKEALKNLRYREEMKIGEDYDLYVRFLLNGGQMHLVGQSYYLYRRHRKSFSHRLSVDDITSMIDAHLSVETNFSNLSPEIQQLFQTRSAALNYSLEYETLVVSIKSRDLKNTFQIFTGRPSLFSALLRSAKERITRNILQKSDMRNNGSGQNIDAFTSERDGFLDVSGDVNADTQTLFQNASGKIAEAS